MEGRTILFYVHDPMCSWCWAFAPTWQALQSELGQRAGDRLRFHYLLGGLAPDSDAPMPESMQEYLRNTWAMIQQRVPGTQFNFDFWTECQPRRSTWPACRAVIAARNQGAEFEQRMVSAIQQGYYLNARNPAERDTLLAFAREIGLDIVRFDSELDAEETRRRHAKELKLGHDYAIQGYPSLVLATEDWWRPITVNYGDAMPMAGQVMTELAEKASKG